MNCYKPDYLQIAIKGQLGKASYWYKCPSEGGKLYIPGFTGAFHCPVATTFCAVSAPIAYVTSRDLVIWLSHCEAVALL
jgi:hypothetical protein